MAIPKRTTWRLHDADHEYIIEREFNKNSATWVIKLMEHGVTKQEWTAVSSKSSWKCMELAVETAARALTYTTIAGDDG